MCYWVAICRFLRGRFLLDMYAPYVHIYMYICIYICRCIEVPCPKAGRSHGEGWEHMEVVVAVSSSSSSSIGQDVDRMVHCHGLDAQTRLREFVASHPGETLYIYIYICIVCIYIVYACINMNA
jgi:3-methyladenine DNA glycosylase Mpg